MDSFAFIIHPLTAQDLSRKYPIAKNLPDTFIEKIIKYIPPLKVSDIRGVKSEYSSVDGSFIACPLTSRQMIELPETEVINKIIRAGKLAEKQGAKVVGLGAFTSVVGDAGITIANNLNIAVTTGNSYTVAAAVEGVRQAAKVMGKSIDKSHIVILGATGSIGAVCAQILAREARYMTLVGKNEIRLEKISENILRSTGLVAKISGNTKATLKTADIIIAVTSSIDSIIEPEDLKVGAIICDVARPRNVSKRVAAERNDVLVIEGGIVEVPGDVDFGINFGFPPKTAYACMAETMILALEKRYENFTIGRDLTVKQVDIIDVLAKKHGFKLAGLRSFERALTNEEVGNIRINAKLKDFCKIGVS